MDAIDFIEGWLIVHTSVGRARAVAEGLVGALTHKAPDSVRLELAVMLLPEGWKIVQGYPGEGTLPAPPSEEKT